MTMHPETLPKSVYFKHGAYYFCAQDPSTKKNRWHRLGKTWGEAFPAYRALIPRLKGDGYLKRTIPAYRDDGVPDSHLAVILKASRANAKARNLAHSLTIEELRTLAVASKGRCQLSGIAFEYGVAKEMKAATTRRKRPWAPSIDRVNGKLGYELSNVRLICAVINIARQEFSDEVLFKMAHALSEMQKAVK
jgi:hypothetical protein